MVKREGKRYTLKRLGALLAISAMLSLPFQSSAEQGTSWASGAKNPGAPTRGYSHVAVGVRDIDAALPLYRDVLGMSVTARTLKSGNGQVPDREAAYLRWPGEGRSFLVLDRVAGETTGTAAKFFEIGFHHIGVDVDDVDAVVEHARARGIRVLREPTFSDAFDFGLASRQGGPPVVKSATLADADGNIVQIDQWIAEPTR